MDKNLNEGGYSPIMVTTPQMKIGKSYWQAQQPIVLEKVAQYNKQKEAEWQKRKAAFERKIAAEGKKAAEKLKRDDLTARNDNTKVLSVSPQARKNYNSQMEYRAEEGAKDYGAWRKKHPTASAWGDVAAAIPFAVVATPAVSAVGSGLLALGNAAAATTAGQAITAGLAPLATAASTKIAGAPMYAWADAALSSLFGAHGVETALEEGGVSPSTALELMPLSRVGKPMYETGVHLVQNINDYNNLKNFINRYGYTEYNPKLGLIFDDAKLDKLTNQLVKQHNRFTRGVSVAEARRHYNVPENWTDELVAEYTLTHPHVPTKINSGGNPKQNSALYTSNSIDLSKLYTDEDGYIGILQRPIIYDTNRSKMLKLNDFRLKRLPNEVNNNVNPSVTTDEPYIFNGKIPKEIIKLNQIKGGLASKRRGKVIRTYTPVSPTFLDAQANAGSHMMPTQNPHDPNFRHYIFYGDPEESILGLEKLIKYTKPKGTPSVDYKPYSVGFSKKKAFGGRL